MVVIGEVWVGFGWGFVVGSDRVLCGFKSGFVVGLGGGLGFD